MEGCREALSAGLFALLSGSGVKFEPGPHVTRVDAVEQALRRILGMTAAIADSRREWPLEAPGDATGGLVPPPDERASVAMLMRIACLDVFLFYLP